MNLIDKVSIISPEDANKLKACIWDFKTITEHLINLKQTNINMDNVRVNVRRSLGDIKSKTKSKFIRNQIEYMKDQLNLQNNQSFDQYDVITNLYEILDDHAHKLMLATLDYDSSKDN